MSADGIGVLGLAILAVSAAPVLIAGAGVAAVAYGAVKAAQYAVETQQAQQQKQEAQRRRRAEELARVSAEDRARIEDLLQSFAIVRNTYEQSAANLRRQQADGVQRLSDELTNALRLGNSNMVQLEQQMKARSAELQQTWQAQSSQLGQQYQQQLGHIAENMKKSVQEGMERFSCMKKAAHQDLQLRDAAADQLQNARSAIKAVSIELGNVPYRLQESLHQAESDFNRGMFVNAYSLSSNIVLKCYDAISEGLSKQAASEALEDKIAQCAATLEGRMEAAENIRFTYQGTEYQDDLSRFSPELFSAIRNRLAQAKNPTAGSLEQRLAALQELDEDFSEIMNLSAQKLLYAYAENDSAESITTAMEAQGFHMEDYAYEGNREGGAIHINYINPVSREKLTVVLTPDRAGLRVEVHNFGDGSGQMDPVQQDRIQKMLERSLNIRISCTNRGCVSRQTDAADLTAVRQLQQNA